MIKFGPNSISSIYFGDERIAEVYVGRKKVWPADEEELDGYGTWFGKGDVPNLYLATNLSSTAYVDITEVDNPSSKFFTFLDGKSFTYAPESALWKTTEPFAFSGTVRWDNQIVNPVVTGAYLSYYSNAWIISPLTGTIGGN